MTAATDDRAGAACSDHDVRRWWADSQARLGAARINTSLGNGLIAPGSAPVLWISMSSTWATGRLVRTGDGSSRLEAHRFSDGHTLLEEQHRTTTVAQLEALVAACSPPARPVTFDR